ncbi:MAG TPA: HU family DNA-binding protein [Thermodesulfobacteriota bacterium]
MNKSELVEVLAARAELPLNKAEEVVNAIFDAMTEALVRNRRIEIRGFGSFVNKRYEPYVGRNPKTGAAIEVKAKTIPFFKVGKELKERVNDGKAPDGAGDADEE